MEENTENNNLIHENYNDKNSWISRTMKNKLKIIREIVREKVEFY